MSDTTTPTTGPLAGLRVINLEQQLSSLVAAQVFSDFGADVIQLEPPGGSKLRSMPAYSFWTRGQEMIETDLTSVAGRSEARELAAASDVVFAIHTPRVGAERELTYQDLAATNPTLIYGWVTAFGSTSPLSNLPTDEGIVMAKMGGFSQLMGLTPRPGPAFTSLPYCSFNAGHLLATGALAALYEREESHHGQLVETSLMQGLMTHDICSWMRRHLANRFPDAFASAAFADEEGIPASSLLFRLLVALTADGRWVQFAQTSMTSFRPFMEEIGLGGMFDNPEWPGMPDLEDRSKRIELWELLLSAARGRTLAQWQELFDSNPKIFAETFRRGPDVLSHPQLEFDASVVETKDDLFGAVRQPGPSIRIRDAMASSGASDLSDTAGSEVADDGGAQSAGESTQTRPPFSGVTVVEFGTNFAGPYGSATLADLGARILKVEPLDGDPLRGDYEFPDLGSVKPLQGKESIAVDLKRPEGREIARRIVARSDLALVAYRAGIAEKLGVDLGSLRAVNPDLIYVDAPGYGSSGPFGYSPAYAPQFGAAAGFGFRNAQPEVPENASLSVEEVERHSVRLFTGNAAVGHVDGFSSRVRATALALGLLARRRGQEILTLETTMLLAAVHANAEAIVQGEQLSGPALADPQLLGTSALHRLYETADGWVFLSVDDGQWSAMTQIMDDGLSEDKRFADPDSRARNDAALADALEQVMKARDAATWERTLQSTGVPCVVVADVAPEIVFFEHGIGESAGQIVTVDHPIFGSYPRLTSLVSFSRSGVKAGPAPVLGEHTDSILAEFGYSADGIKRLRSERVIA